MRLAKKPKTATPKSSKANVKAKKVPKDSNKIKLEVGGNELDDAKVSAALDAILNKLSNAKKSDGAKENLFDEDGQRVNLQITGIKLPKDSKRQIINM